MNEEIYCNTTLNHFSPEGAIPLAVDIYNARKSKREFSVWTNGFECTSLTSSTTDWSNTENIKRTHYTEISSWARQFTGCDKVLFFPAIVRSPSAAKTSNDYAPIEFAHSDYTEEYGNMIRDTRHPYHAILKPSMERDNLSAEQLFKAKRVLTLQLWRNVGPKLMDHPLAICDATTVPRSQLSEFRVESYGGVEAQFDSLIMSSPKKNQDNRWYCFPEMHAGEVLVFRAFDSERAANGQPFWTPHSAFKDPHSSNAPRSSVEMRAICIYL